MPRNYKNLKPNKKNQLLLDKDLYLKYIHRLSEMVESNDDCSSLVVDINSLIEIILRVLLTIEKKIETDDFEEWMMVSKTRNDIIKRCARMEKHNKEMLGITIWNSKWCDGFVRG